MVVNLAAYGLCLILLAFPSAVRASEDLVSKREACRLEARTRIAPKRKIEVEDYRRVVERRTAYVARCIGRNTVARSAAPLPPERGLGDGAQDRQRVAPGRPDPDRGTGRAKRHQSKAAPIRSAKATKLKGRKARLPSRRSR